MKIIENGIIVHFSCGACGCKFVIGINIANTNGDGNYYADCPMCGNGCHAGVQEVKKD